MESVDKRTGLVGVAGLTLLAVISLAVWLGPTASDNSVQANHQVSIGIDTDVSGNSALALGTIQACRVITGGQIIDVDIYVRGLDNLAAWEAYIRYDTSKITITKPGDNTQNNNNRFLLQNAQPTPPGNNVFNTSETLPDTVNPGIYRVGAFDQVVIPGVEDPDPINHTHKDGVLLRLQIQGKTGLGGFTPLQISPFSTSVGMVGPFLKTAEGTLVGDANGDGFIDNVFDGGIVVDTGSGGSCQDDDGDGIPNTSDNCPTVANPNQEDFDGDGLGDACDTDDDNDGLADTNEPSGCRLNPDCDGDLVSDGSRDPDGSGPIRAGPDNCILVPNSNQLDTDGDGLGDACDPDDDNDTILDGADNCPLVYNPTQANFDGDSLGDACDPDDDNDGFLDTTEAHLLTNPLDTCGEPTSSPPVYSRSWPADLKADGLSANKVDLQDVASFVAPTRRINTNPGDAGFHIRWDIVPGNSGVGKQINLLDMSMLTTVKPPMFGGQRAFNGPSCTP